jgi:hypothetical protein
MFQISTPSVARKQGSGAVFVRWAPRPALVPARSRRAADLILCRKSHWPERRVGGPRWSTICNRAGQSGRIIHGAGPPSDADHPERSFLPLGDHTKYGRLNGKEIMIELTQEQDDRCSALRFEPPTDFVVPPEQAIPERSPHFNVATVLLKRSTTNSARRRTLGEAEFLRRETSIR